jgi:outer membrane protein OmpA-like peptidoglycan-associated protein
MNSNFLKILALLAITSILITGCESLSTMVTKHSTDAEYTQIPNPMEARDDSLKIHIVGSYKPNYFNKKMGVMFQPELEYTGGRLLLHPMLMKGESARNLEGTVINKKQGGTFIYTETIPYLSEYRNARLVVNPVVFPAESLLAAQRANAWYPAGAILDRNPNQGQTTGRNAATQNRPARPQGRSQTTIVQSAAAENSTTLPRSSRAALELKDARELGRKILATGVKLDTTPPPIQVQQIVAELTENDSTETFLQPIILKNVDDFDIVVDAGYIINNIYYDFDQADFLSEGTRELDLLITLAMKNPNLKFEITTHTDERGTEAYNAALSQRRLETVTEYIRQRGLDMNRVIARAVGKTEPLFRNARNEEEHALNRRTTVSMFEQGVTIHAERLNYEVVENSPLNSNRTGLWFRVQVGAFREMPTHPLYFFRDHLNAAPGLNLVYYRDTDNLYKFTLGDFTRLEQARRLSQRILDAKKDAHVVAFMDGKSISLAEAETIIKQQVQE